MQRKIDKKYVLRFFCGLLNTILGTMSFEYVWYYFVVENNQTGHLTGYGNLGMAAGIYFALLFFIMRWMGAYKVGFSRRLNLVASVVLSFLVVDFLEVFISMAITGQFRWFWHFMGRYFVLFLLQSVVIGILASLELNLYRKVVPPLTIVEIYSEKTDLFNSLFDKFKEIPYKYVIKKQILCPENADSLKEEIKKYDAVLINDIPDEQENTLIKLCFSINKRIYYVPKISDVLKSHSDYINLFDTPIYLNRNNGPMLIQLAIKRLFDIVLSALALVVLSPLLLVVALAIKIEDGGPVFYKQERVTYGGKKFWILKFRSMIVDAEKDGRSHPAGEKDDRITKVGNVIRKIRVDELPQLINILKGDMSIIGPRPERVEHVEKYTAEIPEFALREKMRGGLSGYAQVYGKYNTSALDKLKMDLIYINNFSILLDVQLIFETFKIIFQKESTEGFSEERQKEIMEDGNSSVDTENKTEL